MKKNTTNTSPGVMLIISILGLLSACETDTCLHGTGENTRIRVETGFFEKLNVYGILHVILVQDTICYVEFEGGDKVLEYVSAENTDLSVSLYNSNSCFYLRDYEKIRAYIHFTHLNKIDLFEVCKVESCDVLDSLYYMTVQGPMAEIDIVLNSDRFGFYNNRTTGGVFTFKGYCDRLKISAYHTAKINTGGIVARDFSVNNSSISDMYVSATELLTVRIHNRGNVYYSGSPQIIMDSISGSGQILPWINNR